MVTVAMQQGLSPQLRWLILRSFLFEKVAQQKDLCRKALGIFILRKKAVQLVFEDGRTAWFEDYDGSAGLDRRFQGIKDPNQEAFRLIEHSPVVERTAAAKLL